MTLKNSPIIPCALLPEVRKAIEDYIEALKNKAYTIGDHGLSEREFWDSGIFHGAIEKLRGTQAASMAEKRYFMDEILSFMKSKKYIENWAFTGAGERHDYEIIMPDGKICIIETKGCLDGNNTNIFERPLKADEFIIWSLCQNPGSDPRHNAWSGIHTRLGTEIIHRKQLVDCVVIWDMVCGTRGRPCPKILAEPARETIIGERSVPPPCVYLLPRSIPDPRDNPDPPIWKINQMSFLTALLLAFKGEERDVINVRIEAKMQGANVQRKTSFFRLGEKLAESKWTTIKRARR